MEEKLILLEQIEYSRVMVDFSDNVDLMYSALVIQFGYIVLFINFFPLAVLFAVLANLSIMFITAKTFATYIKRPVSRQMSTIGIWNQVLRGLSYVAVVYNCFAIIFVDIGIGKKASSPNKGILVKYIVIILTGHGLIVLKYLMDKIIPEMPEWVEKRLKKE